MSHILHLFENVISFLKTFFTKLFPDNNFDFTLNQEIRHYKELLNIVNYHEFVIIVKVASSVISILANPRKYRDRIYIIKDIILTLSEYGQLNQTALFSFCGLNITKHKQILEDLEQNEIIQRVETVEGKRTIVIFKATHKGINFCQDIIEPYEKLFPRGGKSRTPR